MVFLGHSLDLTRKLDDVFSKIKFLQRSFLNLMEINIIPVIEICLTLIINVDIYLAYIFLDSF